MIVIRPASMLFPFTPCEVNPIFCMNRDRPTIPKRIDGLEAPEFTNAIVSFLILLSFEQNSDRNIAEIKERGTAQNIEMIIMQNMFIIDLNRPPSSVLCPMDITPLPMVIPRKLMTKQEYRKMQKYSINFLTFSINKIHILLLYSCE